MRRSLLPVMTALAVLSACGDQRRPQAAAPAQPAPPATWLADPPPWPSPLAARIDPTALRRLVDAARTSGSDALVVVKDGRLVLDERFGKADGPIESMSVTKSVVSLAVGLLVDDGLLETIDRPVREFYPEWNQGRKRRITVRQLLDHTSGLQSLSPEGREEVLESPDIVRLALAAELASDPGTVWAYNNKAVNLLPGIVKKATGRRMDEYLRDRLFRPLGITDYAWELDKAGNPYGMAGLRIRPRDLAKIGEMMASGGLWRGKRILGERWIEAAALTRSRELNTCYGLLWWLVGGEIERRPIIDRVGLAKLRKAGVDPEFIAKARTLKDRTPRSDAEAVELVERTFQPGGLLTWLTVTRDLGVVSRNRCLSPTAFAALGSCGQVLWVSPRDKLVVVSMHRCTGQEALTNSGIVGFSELAEALSVTPAKPLDGAQN